MLERNIKKAQEMPCPLTGAWERTQHPPKKGSIQENAKSESHIVAAAWD